MSEFNIERAKNLLDYDEYGIENEPLEKFEVTEVESNYENQNEELDRDYESSRSNLNKADQMAFEMLKISLENARNSDAPRQVEVFQQLLKQYSDLQSERISIHSKYKKSKNETGSGGNSDGNGNVIEGQPITFSGTPSQLMDRLGSNTDVKRKEKEVNPKKD